MITSDIILRAELQVDDSSELSTDEALDLAQEAYDEICDDRDWEWLKAQHTDSTSTSVTYISLPSDFKKLAVNEYNKSVVFVGSAYREYEVVQFSDRRSYRNQDGYCYVDKPNLRLYFTKQPTSVESVEFDYIKVPAALTLTTAPIITDSKFGRMIAYLMSFKFAPIEQTEKDKSYRTENYLSYKQILTDYQLEDANIKLSI